MAKKTINLGTPNGKDGDVIRDAFKKVNDNFDELYTLTGGTAAELTELAQDYAAEMFTDGTHTGITVTYDDDNNRLNLSVPAGFSGAYADLTGAPPIPDLSAVNQSIIPDTNVAYDLGSPANRFRDLYLSGNTIDLGGALITTTDDGNISLPGVTETRFKPGSIEDGRQVGETFFNESALPEDSVIIDQATWIWAAIGGNQSGGTFQPSVYSATFNGSGFITSITIVEANYYDDTNDWVTVNRDNLYVVPAGTLLTAESISAVGSPIGVLAAGVISTSESIANIPSLNIPTDIGDLTDTGNLLGSGTGDITFSGVRIQGAGTASGDGNGYSTIELVPDSDLYNNDQYLIIDPTAPQHIHIRAGGTIDNSSAELYLGGELNYVRVVDDTGVRLQNRTRNNTFYNFVDPTDFNTATWYESAGTYFVQYTAVNAEIGDLAFTIGNDNENSVTVYYGGGSSQTLTYDSSSSNLGGGVYRFSVVEAPPVSPTVLTAMDFEIWTNRTNSVVLSSNDFEVSVTDDLRLTGSDTVSLRNRSTTEPVSIVTDYDNTSKTWQFGTDGSLTAPGDIIVSGDITGTSGASTLYLKARPDSNTYIQLNNSVDSVISTVANLEIRTDVSNTAKTWEFDTTGNLTFPDATVQTTAYTGPQTTLVGATVAAVGGTASANETGITYSNKIAIFTEGAFTVGVWTDVQVGWTVTDNNGFTDTIASRGGFGAASFVTTVNNWPAPASGKTYVFTSPDYQPASVSPVEISVGNNDWLFSNNGSVTFPDSTVQTTAYTGPQTSLDGDVTGSVFADDSTLLVDGVSGKIVGYVENDRFTVDGNDYQVRIGVGAGATTQGTDAIAIGEGAGNYQQGTRSVAIGRGSGNADQGISAVGIGFCAGGAEQGDYAIAIGFKAGRGPMAGDPDPAQPNNSIIINASGDKLNGTNSGLYVDPVREDTGNTAKAIYYNTTTKELTYANPTGGSGGGDILVSDNSDITVEIDNAGTPGNTLVWTFGTDGNLTLPRGDIVSSDNISLIINSESSTSYSWNFNQLGFLEIPNVNNQLGGTIGDTFFDGGIGIKASEAAGSYVELTNRDESAGIFVQGDSTLSDPPNIQVAIYTTNSGGMEFYGDGNAQLFGDLSLSNITSILGIDERSVGAFTAGSPGVLTINLNQRNGAVRNINTSGGFPFPPLFTANFTVNLTGFTLQNYHFTTVRVEIEQHSSAGYYPSVLQIDGVAQTIDWEGGVNPAPIGGTRDLAVFYIRRTSSSSTPAYSVIGHYIGGNQTRFDGDVTGSVFADDSTLLVDGVSGKIVGDVETARLRTTDPNIALGIAAGETNQGVNTIAIGAAAGQANQGTSSIAIGGQAGNTAQGVSAVALGAQAGSTNQGAIAVSLGTQAGSTNQGLGAVAVGTQAGIVSQGNYAVALGYLAGANNQPANSIVINASGSGLDGSAAGFYVNPVRNLSGTGRILQYDTATKEVSYTNGLVGDLTGSIFADDSTLLVDGVSGKIVGDVSVAEEWKVTVGPDFYTFGYIDGFGSTLGIPGGIRGKLQTALLTGNDIGIIMDGANTPNNVSIGDIANGNILRIESGSSTGDIILTSIGDIDVRSEGAVTIGINLSDSTTRTWRFGEDGDLAFPDATVQTTAWAGIPGPYVDDAAAASAGVAVGYPYHKTGTGGQVFVRLS